MDDKRKIIAGKYELLAEVGSGGMSTVYLARDLNLTKNWAVKEVYKKGVLEGQIVSNGLLAEANLMKNLDHPALPRIVDIIEETDRWYIVMDYIEGETLSEVLKATGPQPQELVIKWAIELAAIMHYLHSQDPPIIYRDMKPANIILQPNGQLKLIDFGIAKRYDSERREDTLALGTDAFAAPEQFYNSKGILVKADVRTDIYNLGATMYNLLTDMLPVDEPYKFLPVRQINPGLSAGIEKIIIKCIEPDLHDRFQTEEELLEALLNYEKLDADYVYRQKSKLKKAYTPVIIGLIMIAAGCFGLIGVNIHDENTYDGLLAQTGSHQSRVENLSKAISLQPGKSEAYELLIEEFAHDGNGLTEEESQQILAIYNNNITELNEKSEEYLDINYCMGENFLVYFTGQSDDSIRNRILMAYPFFNSIVTNGDADYVNYDIAKAYTNLGSFYKNYIVGQGDVFVKEPSSDDYNDLIDNIEKSISSVNKVGNNQLKLMTYRICLSLLMDERMSLVNTTSEDKVMDVIDNIQKNTDLIVTSNSQINKQKEEVLELAEDASQQIKQAYTNSRKQETSPHGKGS